VASSATTRPSGQLELRWAEDGSGRTSQPQTLVVAKSPTGGIKASVRSVHPPDSAMAVVAGTIEAVEIRLGNKPHQATVASPGAEGVKFELAYWGCRSVPCKTPQRDSFRLRVVDFATERYPLLPYTEPTEPTAVTWPPIKYD